MTRRIRHGRAELALHELTTGPGPTLLCLHELGGRGEQWRAAAGGWPGTALALDFGGHGDSKWLAGGGYAPELFAADADAVLATLAPTESVVLVGAGLGAYVALLLAGSRPDVIEVAGLVPGRGLDGGGAHPSDSRVEEEMRAMLVDVVERCSDTSLATDPLVELAGTELRPVDYAGFFARSARALCLGEDAGPRPPWWEAVRESSQSAPGPVEPAEMIAALATR